jgi:hypothetical protein
MSVRSSPAAALRNIRINLFGMFLENKKLVSTPKAEKTASKTSPLAKNTHKAYSHETTIVLQAPLVHIF